jgi:flagellar biosynthesis protein FlhB
MAEDLGDKTEAPTPRRRAEAREQGNIARSPDLTAATLLIGILILLNFYGTGLVEAMRDVLADLLSPRSLGSVDIAELMQTILRSVLLIARAIAPLFIGVFLLAVLVNMAQVGLYFNPKRLQPNLMRLNPLKGLGSLFKGGKGPVQFAMSLTKLSLVAFMAYSAIHGRIAEIVSVQQMSFGQIFGMTAGMVYSIAMRVGIMLLILALIDYLYQRWTIEKQLKMTKQEVKDEMRRMDGDPKVKQRRKQIQFDMASKRMQRDVPTADVVVTNPTEFAVALKYDSNAMHAPRVIAKGQGLLAARIREIAIANGVPILERKPLARALYKLVEVGQEIPEQFYAAVAEILAYVYELSGKAKQRQAV